MPDDKTVVDPADQAARISAGDGEGVEIKHQDVRLFDQRLSQRHHQAQAQRQQPAAQADIGVESEAIGRRVEPGA